MENSFLIPNLALNINVIQNKWSTLVMNLVCTIQIKSKKWLKSICKIYSLSNQLFAANMCQQFTKITQGIWIKCLFLLDLGLLISELIIVFRSECLHTISQKHVLNTSLQIRALQNCSVYLSQFLLGELPPHKDEILTSWHFYKK